MALTPNVVADAPILSSWGNEVRDRSLQVFASEGERGAQWPSPPTGAHSYVTATGSLYLYTGTAWLWIAGAPLGARLRMAGAVNIPGTAAYTVAWDTVSWANGATTATGSAAGITVNESGIYLVSANVNCQYNGSDAINRLSIVVDGAFAGTAAANWQSAGGLGLGLNAVNQLQLTAGQKVQVVFAMGSTNPAAIGTDSHLAVVRQ